MAESTEPKKLTVEDLVKSQRRVEELLTQIANKNTDPIESVSTNVFQLVGTIGLFGCSVASAFLGTVPILCFIAVMLYSIAVLMMRFPRASAAGQSAMREASANQARTKDETSVSRASAMNWR